MKLLLDTCTFLWIITGSKELSKTVERQFLNEENEVFLSVISMWEILIKYELKRLQLPRSPDIFIREQCYLHAIVTLPLMEEAVMRLSKLPNIHQDPFDRMLICQAQAHELAVMTPDTEFLKYSIQVMW